MKNRTSEGIFSNRFRTFAIPVLSFIILAGIIYYLVINADKYLHLVQVSCKGVLVLFALSLAIPIFNGLINVYLFQALGVNLSPSEGYFLAASATLANQLPLPGGIIARGMYLKYKHGLSYAQYFSASLALFFCSIAVNGIVGIFVLLYWILIKHSDTSNLLLIGFLGMASVLFVFFLPVSKIQLPHGVKNWIVKTLQGWVLIRKNPHLLVKILSLQVGFMLLFAVRQWIAFNMLSQSMDITQAILISSGAILTQLVSFAPGGLGVREVIVGAIASTLGYDLTVSVAAVEVDRVISTFTIVITGWISTIILSRRIGIQPD